MIFYVMLYCTYIHTYIHTYIRVHVHFFPVPDNQPIDQVSPPKPHHATPKQIPPPNRAQRLSETPKNLLKGASIGENNEEVNGSSLVKKALDKGVITTPKLKEEKPLLEKNSRIGRSNMDHTKIRKLPQMLVPSRLNKKQMVIPNIPSVVYILLILTP